MAESDRPGPMTFPPTLPAVAGPNLARAAFFREAAGAFEFMALWHSLDVAAQNRVRDALHAAAAESAERGAKR